MKYVSNLEAPDFTNFFVKAQLKTGPQPFGHDVLCDPEFSSVCGYMTHDETAIVYNIAKLFPGKWLEVGSHTGWSGSYVLAAGCELILLDPDYCVENFKNRTIENLKMAGGAEFEKKSTLVADISDNFFAANKLKFKGIIIDGNHDAPCPLNDAIAADKCLEDGGVILFHDYAGQPIKDGVDYLISKGYKHKIYHTPNMIAVCWKSDTIVPDHIPDRRCVR